MRKNLLVFLVLTVLAFAPASILFFHLSEVSFAHDGDHNG